MKTHIKYRKVIIGKLAAIVWGLPLALFLGQTSALAGETELNQRFYEAYCSEKIYPQEKRGNFSVRVINESNNSEGWKCVLKDNPNGNGYVQQSGFNTDQVCKWHFGDNANVRRVNWEPNGWRCYY